MSNSPYNATYLYEVVRKSLITHAGNIKDGPLYFVGHYRGAGAVLAGASLEGTIQLLYENGR